MVKVAMMSLMRLLLLLPPALVVNAVPWRGNEDIQTETSAATRDERCDTENQMQLGNLSR